MDVTIKPCEMKHIEYVLDNIREADLMEAFYFFEKKYTPQKAISLGLKNCFINSTAYTAIAEDGVILMVYGFSNGLVWAATSKHVDTSAYRKTFLKECMLRIAPTIAEYSALSNYVWSKNNKAIMWLTKLVGAEIDGVNVIGGEEFYHFTINKDKRSSLLMRGVE